ncbi:PA2169 family four-helix-bundle protein [Pseudochryseolinea flava]|uniref:Aldehyde dehydrogenase n=1 Tax=Pseudochryseolinea flava TaxID=2059302 RepID=A0A364Y4R0_9BACT|nr:PA2169 family four-helix-bundle protein [Pseudochryseolinea flava]RAW01766.1 aldehyde dehydrogenase [Pseudochryseolinea flava]
MEQAKEIERVIGVLNDLIKINQDRISGYEKAASEIQDTMEAEIKSMYFQHSEESRGFKDSLTESVTRLGGRPADNSTIAGTIYRAWMDVKATFSGDDTVASLQSCEFGEDAALKAYREALDEKSAMPAGVRSLVESQYESLKASHNRVKRYRDEYAAAHK